MAQQSESPRIQQLDIFAGLFEFETASRDDAARGEGQRRPRRPRGREGERNRQPDDTPAAQQLNVFEHADIADSAPYERPAVILENWLRPGSLFVAGEQEAQAIPGVEVGDVLAMMPYGPDLARIPASHIWENPEAPRHERRPGRILRLIQLRDTLRSLLYAECANAPQDQIDELRRRLNEIYDDFVARYGYLNEENPNPRARMKRPNLHYFESDPDCALVSSLEIVDLEEQIFEKNAIFHRNVIRFTPEPVSAETPRDALLISLDRKGRVDIPYMARLLGKTEGETIEALAGEIYLDPETGEYQTAAQYLSGNVRQKLRIAREFAEKDPRWLPNVKALEAVQPEDLTPAEIIPSLGATWIPTSDIREFLAHLLDCSPDDFEIEHNPRTASWHIRVLRANVTRTARARHIWGTHRMNTVQLVECGLNQRDPAVRDRDPETRKYVVNKDETLAAREKLRQIEAEFERWLWLDPDRTERLVRVYNELFNSRVEPKYDGSHLTLPGASSAVKLYPHQKNTVWRILQDGNTLVAHAVGLGKTYVEVAAAMESRRLKLAKKPCLVIPNNLVEQFARHFLTLYPLARILVPTREELNPKNCDRFFARIATSDVDAVIMTHSQFQKLKMSPEFQRRILQEQLEMVRGDRPTEDGRLAGRLHHQAIKALEAKIQKIDEMTRRYRGLTFEETGIDMLIVDEADVFKNITIWSKNPRLAQQGSARADDLMLKVRYINQLTPRRNVVFATGTPISNSLVEIYTTKLYLMRDRLAELGLLHFDAWAANYIVFNNVFELAPAGGYRMYARPGLKNAPEAIALWREVADYVSVKDTNLEVPDVKRIEVVVQPTTEQEAYFNSLIERAARIESGKPRPITTRTRDGQVKTVDDFILYVMSDGRKAALDLRLIDPDAVFLEPGNKIIECVQRATEVYFAGSENRATQLIFCDLSTPSGKRPGEFHVYNELRHLLIQQGVSPEHIAFAQDAKTDKAKARLYKAVNEGRIRILIASTETAGVGANVQERLKALHHLDPAWRPRDMEQREGRIIRQGNLNKEVLIFTYVTERSFDAYMYQALERKARDREMLLRGDRSLRVYTEESDVVLSYAMIKAIASGNPLVREKAELESEIARLSRLLHAEEEQRRDAREKLSAIPQRREILKNKIEALKQDLAARQDTSGDQFQYVAPDGSVATKREEAARFLIRAHHDAFLKAQAQGVATVYAGKLGGFELHFDKARALSMHLVFKGRGRYHVEIPAEDVSAIGLVRRAENFIKKLDEELASCTAQLERLDIDEENYREFLATPSRHRDRLIELRARLEDVDRQLGIGRESLNSDLDDIPEAVDDISEDITPEPELDAESELDPVPDPEVYDTPVEELPPAAPRFMEAIDAQIAGGAAEDRRIAVLERIRRLIDAPNHANRGDRHQRRGRRL